VKSNKAYKITLSANFLTNTLTTKTTPNT